MTPNCDDLVQEEHVVAGEHLHDHADHPLAVVDLRRVQNRQEHADAGMGVDVRRTLLARLVQVGEIHRRVAQRESVRAAQDRQVNPEGRDDDSSCDPRGRGGGC